MSFLHLSDADHSALDGSLSELLQNLTKSPSPPYGRLARRAEEIINNMERKRLMRPGWKDSWRDSEIVYGAWFGDLRNAVNKALLAVFTEMARYVVSATTPRRKEKYAGLLTEALEEYLDLRGYRISTPNAGSGMSSEIPATAEGCPAGETTPRLARPDQGQTVFAETPLSAADLATHLGQPVSRVETFLRRYRAEHLNCFREVANPRRNEPRYLYYLNAVWPALEKQVNRWNLMDD